MNGSRITSGIANLSLVSIISLMEEKLRLCNAFMGYFHTNYTNMCQKLLELWCDKSSYRKIL